MVVSYTSIAAKFYCGTHPQHHGAIRRERKLTKTLFIVTIVSLILVMPFTIFWFLFHVTSGEKVETISHETWRHLALSLNGLFYGNSLINPLLYALKMPQFKRALFLLLRCKSRAEPVLVLPPYDLKVGSFTQLTDEYVFTKYKKTERFKYFVRVLSLFLIGNTLFKLI